VTPTTPAVQSPASVVQKRYTYEELMIKKRKELDELRIQRGLPSGMKLKSYFFDIVGKSKAEISRAILKAQDISQDQLKNFHDKLSASQKVGTLPQHEYYRSHFNAVDLHDRYWNQIQNPHGVRNWKSKMVEAIIYTAIINAWSFSQFFESCSINEFQNALSLSLLDKSLNLSNL